jgi:hypothetical protein
MTLYTYDFAGANGAASPTPWAKAAGSAAASTLATQANQEVCYKGGESARAVAT